MRRWLKFALAAIAVLVCGLTFKNTNLADKASLVLEQHQPGLYSVSYFVDGDTLAVNMNGQVEKVRFVGVDTPETHKPNTPVQCF